MKNLSEYHVEELTLLGLTSIEGGSWLSRQVTVVGDALASAYNYLLGLGLQLGNGPQN